MSATALAVASAVRDKIALVDGADCAVLELVPEFDLSQVRDLQIIISPQSYNRGNAGSATRNAPDSGVKVGIAIMKKCAGKNEIPNLLELTERIAAGIERNTLDGSGIVTMVEFDPLYDMQVFRKMKVFIAACVATVKVIR